MIPYVSVMFEVILSPRDVALLRLLDLTPATVPQLRKASVTFGGEPFHDDRRVRERLQALSDAGLMRSWQAAIPGGGLMLYFRLTLEGHRAAFGEAGDSPSRTSLSEIAPSRVKHAMITADAIVHTLVASHERGVRVLQSHGDGQLTLEIGEYRQQPDCHFQFGFGGRFFNLLFEIDNATEPLDSRREHSIRTKILGYETYQNWALRNWRASGEACPRPAFRVVFLTTGEERANQMLWLAHDLARNKHRHLVYATTQDAFLHEPHALTQPIFLDHHGHWQALVDPYPSAPFLRPPVPLTKPIVQLSAF